MAAAVTDSPAGSIISVRIKSPGWGGFFMGIALAPLNLVVVFQIQVADFQFFDVDAERQSAVTRDAKAPPAPTISGEGVHFPQCEVAEFLSVLHIIAEGHHLSW